MSNLRNILEEYDKCHDLYIDFVNRIQTLLQDLLTTAGFSVLSVSPRVKSKDSLRGKIQRPDAGYQKLDDVTDIAGIRIITYLEDEVDKIGEIIRAQFIIDEKNSVDKRAKLDPDRFGYLSLHFIVTLPDQRTDLPEYSRFKGLKLEIQIRSILQHAWAEIEHDLGYKSKVEVPKEVRRQFSRLAGLLEIADCEFNRIKESLKNYEQSVGEQITNDPTSVSLNKASLVEYVRNSKLVKELDSCIALISKSIINVSDSLLPNTVDLLSYFGVEDINQLENELKNNRDLVMSLAEFYLSDKKQDDLQLNHGISLFYLAYVLAARTGSLTEILDYIDFADIDIEERREEIADKLLSWFSSKVKAD